MKPSSKSALVVSCALMGFLANVSSAAIATYTNRTAFEAALEQAYFQNFASYTGGVTPTSSSFVSGIFNYTVSAETSTGAASTVGLYGDKGSLGVASGNDSLVITLNTPTYGIGGQFYFSDFDAIFVSSSLAGPTKLTLTLSDNSTYVYGDYNPTSVSTSYRGFVASGGLSISKLTFSFGFPDYYATVDTLTVGYNTQPIPEPAAYGLMVGLASLVCLNRRRRRS